MALVVSSITCKKALVISVLWFLILMACSLRLSFSPLSSYSLYLSINSTCFSKALSNLSTTSFKDNVNGLTILQIYSPLSSSASNLCLNSLIFFISLSTRTVATVVAQSIISSSKCSSRSRFSLACSSSLRRFSCVVTLRTSWKVTKARSIVPQATNPLGSALNPSATYEMSIITINRGAPTHMIVFHVIEPLYHNKKGALSFKAKQLSLED